MKAMGKIFCSMPEAGDIFPKAEQHLENDKFDEDSVVMR
jgi:hypothetical protein